MKKEDIKISLQNNILTLSGERKKEKEKKQEQAHTIKRSYGSIYRFCMLPTEVQEDKIEANFKNGILNVIIPKAEVVEAKTIEIK